MIRFRYDLLLQTISRIIHYQNKWRNNWNTQTAIGVSLFIIRTYKSTPIDLRVTFSGCNCYLHFILPLIRFSALWFALSAYYGGLPSKAILLWRASLTCKVICLFLSSRYIRILKSFYITSMTTIFKCNMIIGINVISIKF